MKQTEGTMDLIGLAVEAGVNPNYLKRLARRGWLPTTWAGRYDGKSLRAVVQRQGAGVAVVAAWARAARITLAALGLGVGR